MHVIFHCTSSLYVTQTQEVREMKGWPEETLQEWPRKKRKKSRHSPASFSSKGPKHAGNHKDQAVVAAPGPLTVWLCCCNREDIGVFSRIPGKSMSECLVLQSDSPSVWLSLLMERISIDGSECRTFSERSTLSSALIKRRTREVLWLSGFYPQNCHCLTGY